MDETNFSILHELEKLLTYENIDKLKNDFLNSFNFEEQPYLKIEDELGEINYYDSQSNKIKTIKFENKLTEILENTTEKIKTGIDDVFIKINSQKRKNFINYLKTSFDYIQQTQDNLLKKYPICSSSITEIKTYLFNKYNISLEKIHNKNFRDSIFRVKYDIKSKAFKDLYIIACDLNIINEDTTSEEEFISVLTEYESDYKIKFNCSTGLTANFLNTISLLFENLTSSTIEESQRFYTKQNKVLTQSNYNTSKKRLKNSGDILTFEKFKKEFDKLCKIESYT